MASLDNDIDQLYRLPPGEFTAARNAVAKNAGAGGAAIKALEKPSVAAWAVNQLYWQRRPLFDKLVAASEKLRGAQAKQLAGKSSDVAAMEAAHRDARRAAMDAVRDILRASGDPASPATLTGVNETLMALPTGEPPGRLSRALKPLGFQALVGMLSGAVPSAGPGGDEGDARRHEHKAGKTAGTAEKTPDHAARRSRPEPSKTTTESAAEARRNAEAARREAAVRAKQRAAAIEQAVRELKDAQADEREARIRMDHARKSSDTADRLRDRLDAELKAATEEASRLASEAAGAEQRATRASEARAALEARLTTLKQEP